MSEKQRDRGNLIYRAGHSLCRFFFIRLRRVRVRGLENIPPDGALIVAPNHSSFLDPILVGSSCPFALSYMAKKELFSVPLLGRILPLINVFPVERESSDVGAIRAASRILEKSGPLLLFPEGTRGKNKKKSPKLGAAYFAAKFGAPVIPVLVTGAAAFFSFKPVEIVWGKPIEAPVNPSKDDCAMFTRRIIGSVYSLAAKKEGAAGSSAVGGEPSKPLP